MFLRVSRGCSEPTYLASLSSAARSSRNFHSLGVKSTSLTKLRWCRLKAISDPFPLDGAGHAARTAATAPQFVALDRHDLDAVLAQVGIGGDVALVGDHHAGAH